MYDRVYVGVTKAEFVKAEKLVGPSKTGERRSFVWDYPGVGSAVFRPVGPKGERGYGFVKLEPKA